MQFFWLSVHAVLDASIHLFIRFTDSTVVIIICVAAFLQPRSSPKPLSSLGKESSSNPIRPITGYRAFLRASWEDLAPNPPGSNSSYEKPKQRAYRPEVFG